MKKIILWLLPLVCCCAMNAHALEIMLPQIYTEGIDVSGWLMSEKLDGVRGYWDGKQLLSKNGNPFYPPAAFTRNFPPFALEGELWGGRRTFEKTVSIVKKQQPHDGWLELQFAIFDVPQATGGFIRRLQRVKDWFANHPNRFAFVIPQKNVADNGQLKTELQRVEKLGGEGLIVRKPDTLYANGRSRNILKVKNFFDMEAVVIAHIKGKGRNQGRLGSLLVELPENSKIKFKIGTGFSDEERDNPPPVGSIITFKYYGFYKSGLPKFPSFLRIRTDTAL
ncbi:MAG: DNA ligase [Thermodesulfobacteriota bacterium]|nr:DNA ligase [Thermodesulfobacteriota bacterium]